MATMGHQGCPPVSDSACVGAAYSASQRGGDLCMQLRAPAIGFVTIKKLHHQLAPLPPPPTRVGGAIYPFFLPFEDPFEMQRPRCDVGRSSLDPNLSSKFWSHVWGKKRSNVRLLHTGERKGLAQRLRWHDPTLSSARNFDFIRMLCLRAPSTHSPWP